MLEPGRKRPMGMMMNVLVVESQREQRASVVDALCELSGVEVCATADGAAAALNALRACAFDVVVTAGTLPYGTTAALIEAARGRGVQDVIVFGDREVAHMRDYWLELGACRVVDTVPALVACAAGLVDARARTVDRKRRLDHLEVAIPQVGQYSVGSLLAGSSRAQHNVRLRELLHSTLERFGQAVPHEVQVVLECVSGLPLVRCVPRDLERLVFSLVLDACDAMPLGGKLWVVAESIDPRRVRIEVLESSGTCRELTPGSRELGAIVALQGGEMHVVQHGSATSVQIVLPAVVGPQN